MEKMANVEYWLPKPKTLMENNIQRLMGKRGFK